MQHNQTIPPKPRAEVIRPEITRLPVITPIRQVYRVIFQWVVRLIVRVCTRADVHGLENIPQKGPVLFVSNHLGDADFFVGLAFAPVLVEFLGKAELYDLPVLGKLLDAYGVIWVHRGQPDRRALRAALNGLKEGRMVAIAPEGRESLTGSLEEGTGGAAYLAIKAGVPLIPAAFTGTENARVYGNLKRLRRTDVTLTIGEVFKLETGPDRRKAIESGTQKIMERLASLLPVEYQGIYESRIKNNASSNVELTDQGSTYGG